MRPIRFVFLVLMLAIGVSDSAIRGMFSVRILPIGISRYQRGKTMCAGCFWKQKAKKNAFKQKNHPKICVIQKKAVLLQPLLKRGCHRITVSTQDFHSCNRGSIPLGTTKWPSLKSLSEADPLKAKEDLKTKSASRTPKQQQRWQITKALWSVFAKRQRAKHTIIIMQKPHVMQCAICARRPTKLQQLLLFRR